MAHLPLFIFMMYIIILRIQEFFHQENFDHATLEISYAKAAFG